jgi:hypothetical protein
MAALPGTRTQSTETGWFMSEDGKTERKRLMDEADAMYNSGHPKEAAAMLYACLELFTDCLALMECLASGSNNCIDWNHRPRHNELTYGALVHV